MKAAIYEGPGKMVVKEVPTPEPKPGEILLKVKTCAVCGTDVRIYTYGQKNVKPPMILGHEIGGIIEEIGQDVEGDFQKGDIVTVVTSVGDQTCYYCQKGYYNLCDNPRYIGYYFPGGFAEYVIIPEQAVKGNNIIKIDVDIDFPEISMIEPLSCCVNGQEYLNIQAGEIVVIFGGGPIGCMHAELARVKQAEKIILIDIVEEKLELAKKVGVTHVINSGKEDVEKKIKALTDGHGADVVITACSVKNVQETALEITAKKGRISYFAGVTKDDPFIKFNSNILHYNEISLFGAFASYRKQFEMAYDLIASGHIDAKKFITHKFPLDDIIKAFELKSRGEGLKSIIEM